ncbi:MAG: YdcF family protein [Proteobacteria bacterium]|nr:YdcF family protein [Pseudomonadota bacterium]
MTRIPDVVRHALAFAFVAVMAALAIVGLIWLLSRVADSVGDAWADAYVIDDAFGLPSADVGLVLGTAPYGVGGQRYRTLSYRLKAAADLWSSGKVKYLVVSGSRIADYDEPTAMRAGLIALGVPETFIYRDFAGFRTWESMVRVRDIYGQRQVIVVSERDHLARALFIGRHIGMEAWGYPARGLTYTGFRGEFLGGLAMLRAYCDVVVNRSRRSGPKVAIGVDPAN